MIINGQFLANTRKLKQVLCSNTNTGMAGVNMEDDLTGLGVIWYHWNGTINVLSQSKAVKVMVLKSNI